MLWSFFKSFNNPKRKKFMQKLLLLVHPDKNNHELAKNASARLLELKNMFDLSQELNTEILTKVMFTFSNDEILSPLALPKELLHAIIDEALEYMEPLATRKQRSLIEVLKNLKNRETFTATKKGKERQERIDKIRRQDITKILAKDKRILDWWKTI